ncbi:hypothetical protein Plhal304r1_c025g0085061 [Plasmopara halstedii]
MGIDANFLVAWISHLHVAFSVSLLPSFRSMTHAIGKTFGSRADECYVIFVHIIGDIFLSPLPPVFQVSKILNRISSVAPVCMLLSFASSHRYCCIADSNQ